MERRTEEMREQLKKKMEELERNEEALCAEQDLLDLGKSVQQSSQRKLHRYVLSAVVQSGKHSIQ